jgi:hypothetical protein
VHNSYSPVSKRYDLDECLKIGCSTAMECMKKEFAEGVIAMFGEEYLRQPTREDLERLLKLGESFGPRKGFSTSHNEVLVHCFFMRLAYM